MHWQFRGRACGIKWMEAAQPIHAWKEHLAVWGQMAWGKRKDWRQIALGSNPVCPAYRLSHVKHTPLSTPVRILTTASWHHSQTSPEPGKSQVPQLLHKRCLMNSKHAVCISYLLPQCCVTNHHNSNGSRELLYSLFPPTYRLTGLLCWYDSGSVDSLELACSEVGCRWLGAAGPASTHFFSWQVTLSMFSRE